MKAILHFIFLFLTFLTGFCQIEKGKSLNSIEVFISDPAVKSSSLSANIKHLKFLTPIMAVGGRISANTIMDNAGDEYADLSIGPEARFYLPVGGQYIFGGIFTLLGYDTAWEEFTTTLGAEAGVTYFLTSNIAIEPKVQFKQRNLKYTLGGWQGYDSRIHEKRNSTSLMIGLQIYLNGRRNHK